MGEQARVGFWSSVASGLGSGLANVVVLAAIAYIFHLAGLLGPIRDFIVAMSQCVAN